MEREGPGGLTQSVIADRLSHLLQSGHSVCLTSYSQDIVTVLANKQKETETKRVPSCSLHYIQVVSVLWTEANQCGKRNMLFHPELHQEQMKTPLG